MTQDVLLSLGREALLLMVLASLPPMVMFMLYLSATDYVSVLFDTRTGNFALLACGLALVTLAGLELALREHLAGFRSHSTLVAGACALAVTIPLALATDLPKLVLLGVAVLVFGAAFALLRSVFRSRSGGLGFRA